MCRLHGSSCRTSWGWDAAHTDSPRPHLLEELAGRSAAPHRFAYMSAGEYEAAFYLWRALRRDGRLNAEESGARPGAVAAWLGIEEQPTDLG